MSYQFGDCSYVSSSPGVITGLSCDASPVQVSVSSSSHTGATESGSVFLGDFAGYPLYVSSDYSRYQDLFFYGVFVPVLTVYFFVKFVRAAYSFFFGN